MKVLSAETNLSSATNVGSASVVRIFNSDSSTATITKKDSGGSTIGTFTVGAGEVIYCEKNYTDTLEGGATFKVSKTAYSSMMSYSSTYSSGGGGGGIVTNNLYLHLDASNSSSYSGSGTAWNDLSGNSNNVTLVNGPTYSSNDGGYLDFDGTNDYINANTALPDSFFQGNSTLSFWLYFNTVDSDSQGQAIIHHGTNSAYKGFHVMQRVSKVNIDLWGTALETTSTFSASTWYNITITLNNTTNACVIYINGSSDASGTLSASYTGTGNNCRIAGPIIEGGVFHDELHARIAQVFAYDAVLTASEVLQNYDATKSNYV